MENLAKELDVNKVLAGKMGRFGTVS